MPDQSLEPAQLIVEFGARPRISVGKIEPADEDTIYGRLDIAAMAVIRIAGKAAPGFVDLANARQYRDAVPAFLAMLDRVIASGLDRTKREFLVWRLQLLEADDVRRILLKPAEEDGKTAIDAVHIIGGDFHSARSISLV